MKRYQDAEGRTLVTEAGQPVGRAEMAEPPSSGQLPRAGQLVALRPAGKVEHWPAEIVYADEYLVAWVWSERKHCPTMYGNPNLLSIKPIKRRAGSEINAVEGAMKDIGAEDYDYAEARGVVERMIAAGYRKQ